MREMNVDDKIISLLKELGVEDNAKNFGRVLLFYSNTLKDCNYDSIKHHKDILEEIKELDEQVKKVLLNVEKVEKIDEVVKKVRK